MDMVWQQFAFQDFPPHVMQAGKSIHEGLEALSFSQGDSNFRKMQETVVLLQHSFWQFFLKSTFLSLISTFPSIFDKTTNRE